jgi:Holliday junction resolvasome RuvABC endonuclease subunit
VWPYPVGLYPITFSYRSAPVIAQNAGDVNIWTTKAEAMVRHYAEARIHEIVIGDQQMAQLCMETAIQEFLDLQQQTSQKGVREGIPPSDW